MVQNRLAEVKKDAKKNEVVYMANGVQITLTPEIVKNYLVSGNKDKVTTQELVMYINLCKFNGLNPWLKEAYCIKYGNEPATIVPAKDAFLKRAEANADFDGYKAGIIIYNEESGEFTYREGSMLYKNEIIAGGFAEVYRKNRNHPYRAEVAFDEYAGKKADGSLNSNWSKRPATMIRKVALVQALREAFPSSLGGLVTAEEQGIDEPIDVAYNEPTEETIKNAPVVNDTVEEAKEVVAPKSSDDVANALFG